MLQKLKNDEEIALKIHRSRLQKLHKDLREEEKIRLEKIVDLLSSLREEEVAYLRYKMLSAVEIPSD